MKNSESCNELEIHTHAIHFSIAFATESWGFWMQIPSGIIGLCSSTIFPCQTECSP